MAPPWGPSTQFPPFGGPQPPPTVGASPPYPAPVAHRSGARWLAVGLAALVVLAGVITAFFLLKGPGSNGLASKSPNQIVQAAVTAVQKASGFEMSGTGNFGGGVTGFDFKVRGSNVDGSMALDGSTVDLEMLAGNVYFKAPAAFWTTEGATGDVVTQYANRWVEIPASSASSSGFPDISSLTNISSALEKHGTLASGGTGTVNGQAAVFVKDTTNGGTVAIATTGPGYPLRLTSTSGSTSGAITFSNWDGVSAFAAPPNPISIPGG